MTEFDVINIADIFADVVMTGPDKPTFGQTETLADGYEIELGGSGPIFAAQFSMLGGRVALLGYIGNDLLGDFVMGRMGQAGIETQYIRRSSSLKTALGLNISVRGDRSMLTVPGAMNEISPSIVDDSLLEKTRHWHISSYFLLTGLTGFWPGFLEKLKRKGITVSLDTNWSPGGNWDQVTEILPMVDLFLPNEVEAMAITGEKDYREAGRVLSGQTGLVVIKRGEEGASAFTGGRETWMPVGDVVTGDIRVVDTTGAGDSFNGGFIFEWLKGRPVAQCLNTAIGCGTRNVQHTGGIGHLFKNK
jgi:ribokinase